MKLNLDMNRHDTFYSVTQAKMPSTAGSAICSGLDSATLVMLSPNDCELVIAIMPTTRLNSWLHGVYAW